MAASIPISPRYFKKGDFIKNKQREGSFAIFEGRETTPPQYTLKHYSLAVYFEPKKYELQSDGRWDYRPFLEVSTPSNPCKNDCDTLKEDYWWELCTENEIDAAIQVLYDNGYIFDRNELSITDRISGKVIRRLIGSKPKYNGETVKPIGATLKASLHNCIHFKPTAAYPNYGYRPYEEYYD